MCKRLLLLAFTCLLACTGTLRAAEPQIIETIGGERPIQLKAVKVDGHLAGHMAQTTYELTFFNPNARQLEGQLRFPLLPGQQISGFALDFNKEFRPAMPVEKAKGRQVFEETVRQKIDPALLENTGGNQFKLRVYPIPPQGERRVQITVSEVLAAGKKGMIYRLPLQFAQGVADFQLGIRAAGLEQAPVASHIPGALRFSKADGVFEADTRKLALNPQGELALEIKSNDKPQTYTQTLNGETYFLATIPVRQAAQAHPRQLPNKVISLLWDSSGSGKNRKIDQELALLDAYFKAVPNIEVRLQRLRDVAEPVESFKVVNGNWAILRKTLQSTVYDGASSFDFAPQADIEETLLFSDGQVNYGSKGFPLLLPTDTPSPALKRLYAINSAAGADTDRLAALAEARNGQLIDLTAGLDAARRQLLTSGAYLSNNQASLSGSGLDRIIVQKRPTPQGEQFLIAGRLTDKTGKLQTGYLPCEVCNTYFPVNLTIERKPQDTPQVAALWASLQIARLNGEYELNRGEIRRLGLKFSLPTRETSLIVLDRVEDYVRHDIEPPASLKTAFDSLRSQKRQQLDSRRQKQADAIANQFKARIAWWEKDFPKDEPPKPELKLKKDTALNEQASASSTDRAAPMAMAPAPAPAMAGAAKSAAPAGGNTESQISITLKKWTPDTPYLKRLKDTGDKDLYRVYLDEKPSWANSSAFYLDVADHFAERGQKTLALRILSNLAEMELENRQILRLLAYRLLQMDAPKLAIPLLKDVQRLADEEPQSFRDLGLAYAAAGMNQQAIDQLNEVILRPWDGRFAEIELITVGEINGLIAAHPQLDTGKIDPRLIRNLPLDIRAVLSWDADNSDMDLWITDPNNEKCYYGHRDTYQGGHMSRDFTGGYGPEEFLLKKAKPGKYKVEANFYGNQQQAVAGATSLQLKLFMHFGTPQQAVKTITLRLKGKGETVYVGEFEVK